MVKTSPSNAGGRGSIPGQGAKIPHALQPKNQNIKHKQYCNKFNKHFKNSPRKKTLKKKKNKNVKDLDSGKRRKEIGNGDRKERIRSQMCVQWNEEAGRNAGFGNQKICIQSPALPLPCLHDL